MKKKIIVDILMFILMLLEFSRGYIAPIWHEIFGILLVVLIILHLILNKIYFKNLAKGDYSTKRIIMLIINIVFFLTFFLSIIFGILSSQELFKFLNLGNLGIQNLHKIFSYISLISLGLHLGINFNAMFGKISKKINNKIILYLISGVIVIYGIYSFIKLEIIDHLVGKYGFGLVDGNIFLNIFRYLSVVMMLSIMMNFIYSKIKR